MLVNHLRQAKVGNEEIRILVLAPEQEVFRLEIYRSIFQSDLPSREIGRRRRTPVDDAGVVEVRDSTHDHLDELGRVVLVVGPLGADSVEKFATGAEVRHEVY